MKLKFHKLIKSVQCYCIVENHVNIQTLFVIFGTSAIVFGLSPSFGLYLKENWRTISFTETLNVLKGIRSRNVKSRFMLRFMPSWKDKIFHVIFYKFY